MKQAEKRLRILAVFTFVLAPLFSWGSVIATDETAVFASLSRMIWYSGSSLRIFIAMLVLFVPMLIAFFLAHSMSGLTKTRNLPEHDLKNPSEHGYCLFKNCCAIIRFIAERTSCHDWM